MADRIKELGDKDVEELTDREAAELAYARSNASLDDYDPEQLDGLDDPNRVMERGDRGSVTKGEFDKAREERAEKAAKRAEKSSGRTGDKPGLSDKEKETASNDRKADERIAGRETARLSLPKND